MRVAQFERFFSQPPDFPNPNVDSVRPLDGFIREYPNTLLVPNLRKLEQNYRYYRAIRGDGNCFYRAIMFQYIRDSNLVDFQTLFPKASIFTCENLPFRCSYTSDNLLRYIWERYLLPLDSKSKEEREEELGQLLNLSQNLDACLVAYFRALNHDCLKNHRSEYEFFSSSGYQNDLKRARTFGKESEECELYSLARILRADITVLMVHQENYKQIELSPFGHKKHKFVVSFRPGHYDIPIAQKYNRPLKYSSQPPTRTPDNSSFNSSVLQTVQRAKRPDFPERKTLQPPQPQVIVVNNPSQIRRLTMRQSLPSKIDDFSISMHVKQPKKIPNNMAEFKKARKPVQEQEIDNFKNTQVERQIPWRKRSKSEKATMLQIRKQNQNKNLVMEVSFCVFGFLVLFISLFIL